MPTAWARSRAPVNVCVKMASVAGNSIAAPTPCKARKATRAPAVGAAAQRAEPSAKTSTPAR
jgi:hypothetical protein